MSFRCRETIMVGFRPSVATLLCSSLLLAWLVPVPACRWAAYAGLEPLPASAILSDPPHSLVRQSYLPPTLPQLEEALAYRPEHVLARNHDVNLDGWGVGWYDASPHAPATARRERSARGAVNRLNRTDKVLSRLSERVSSQVILAHVRAATDGDNNAVNSHPFQYNQLLWMHNGGIAEKEALSALVRCNAVRQRLVAGATDSEYAGVLFCEHLYGDVCARRQFSRSELVAAMASTVARIQQLHDTECSSINFAVSDGSTIVVTRYRTCIDQEPPSLYYSRTADGVFVASEPLDSTAQWHLLPKDSMMSFNIDDQHLTVDCLSSACEAEFSHRCKLHHSPECAVGPGSEQSEFGFLSICLVCVVVVSNGFFIYFRAKSRSESQIRSLGANNVHSHVS